MYKNHSHPMGCQRFLYKPLATEKMESPSTFDQLKSILALPFMVIVVIPILINYLLTDLVFNPLYGWNPKVIAVLGFFFLIIGATLFIQSIILFVKIGKGTLAPWNPTRKIVVKGLYRHMRNPMICGVCGILLAEAFLFKSIIILSWSLFFLLLNHVYFILKEEPDLIKRFGAEYQEYKDNVPRWIPRLRGWKPEENET